VETIFERAQRDVLVLEQNADIDLPGFPCKMSGRGDAAQVTFERISQLGQMSGKVARAGPVEAVWGAKSESFVRSQMVVFVLKLGEAVVGGPVSTWAEKRFRP
jgi:hypothetical protein